MTVVWNTSDPSVATVSDGKITAVGAGECQITAKTADGKHSAVCTVTVTGTSRLPGDVNSDGAVDLKDVTVVRRYVAEWEGVTLTEANADVDGDNAVNLKDVTILRRYVAEWDGVVLV